MSKAIVYMALAVFLYALTNVFVKWLAHVPSMEVVFFRSAVSLLITAAVLKQKRLSLWGHNKKFLLTRGFFGAMALLLSYAALPHLPLATVSVIGYLAPIFTVILAVVWLGEKVHPLQWYIFLFTFSGVLLIKGFDPNLPLVPFAVGLVAIFCSACGYVTIRKAKDMEPSLRIVFYTSLISLPLSAISNGTHWSVPGYTATDWLLLILLGVLTQLAQVLMTKAYQMEDAVKVANVNYTSIVYALLMGYFFFGEVLNWLSLLGIVMVLVGVYSNAHHGRLLALLRRTNVAGKQ